VGQLVNNFGRVLFTLVQAVQADFWERSQNFKNNLSSNISQVFFNLMSWQTAIFHKCFSIWWVGKLSSPYFTLRSVCLLQHQETPSIYKYKGLQRGKTLSHYTYIILLDFSKHQEHLKGSFITCNTKNPATTLFTWVLYKGKRYWKESLRVFSDCCL